MVSVRHRRCDRQSARSCRFVAVPVRPDPSSVASRAPCVHARSRVLGPAPGGIRKAEYEDAGSTDTDSPHLPTRPAQPRAARDVQARRRADGAREGSSEEPPFLPPRVVAPPGNRCPLAARTERAGFASRLVRSRTPCADGAVPHRLGRYRQTNGPPGVGFLVTHYPARADHANTPWQARTAWSRSGFGHTVRWRPAIHFSREPARQSAEPLQFLRQHTPCMPADRAWPPCPRAQRNFRTYTVRRGRRIRRSRVSCLRPIQTSSS